MWTILKVFIEFVTIPLLFMFWFFGHEACGFLVSPPGLEPAPLRWKVKSTTGPPGKSLNL